VGGDERRPRGPGTLPYLLTREQSAASIALFQAEFDQRGYGWWAVEVLATGEFVGFTGLDQVDEDMPFTGVEIGWRMAARPGATGTPPRPPRPAWPSTSTPSSCLRSLR
jgi:RimJ/RimL family protein N-acetyltransferase